MATNIDLQGTPISGLPRETSPEGIDVPGMKSGRTVKVSLDLLATKDDVENIENNRKGYFPTDAELNATYPTPIIGWYAYIGSTNTIWIVSGVGTPTVNTWVDSGNPIPSDVDLSLYAKNGGSNKTLQQVDEEIVQINHYIFNVSQVLNNYAFASKENARANVPVSSRGLGQLVLYKLASGEWIFEKYIGDDVANWNTFTNWENAFNYNFYPVIFPNITGKYVNASGGETFSAGYNCSDYLACKSGDVFTIMCYAHTTVSAISLFDSDKNFISGLTGTAQYKEHTATATADGYVRFSYNGNYPISARVITKNADVAYKSITSNLQTVIDNLGLRTNSYDNDFTEDVFSEYVNSSGAFVTIANFRRTDFLKVKQGDIVTVVGAGTGIVAAITFYDSNYNKLSNVMYTLGGSIEVTLTANVPANAVYVVCCSVVSENTPNRRYTVQTDTIPFLIGSVNEAINIAEESKNRKLAYFIPKKIYAVQGEAMRIYPRNMFNMHPDDRSIDVFFSNQWAQSDDCYFVNNPQENQTIDVSLINYDGIEENIGSMELIVSNPANPSIPLFILPIGDSQTVGLANSGYQGAYPNELSRLFNGTGTAIPNGRASKGFSNISVIGTLGDQPIKHEGRGGWSLNNYLNTQSAGGITNAFYNPAKSKFDLDYYLTQNGFYTEGVAVDGSNLIIPIMLNWNSMFKDTDSIFISRYNELLSLIHTSHPAAKVLLLGVNAPARDMYFAVAAKVTSYTQLMGICIRYEEMLQEIAESEQNNAFCTHVPVMAFFCNRESYLTTTTRDNIRTSTTDVYQTDTAHPITVGYGQFADVFYRAICSFLN